MGSLGCFLKVPFVFPTRALRISSKINPKFVPFNIEALLVEYIPNTIKAISSCPSSNLRHLSMVVDTTGL